MRLIDADELIKDIMELWDYKTVDGITATTVLKQTITDIENQPTVNAIPIDKPFLKMRYGDYVVYNKKWLVNHLQTEWNILQGKEYQPAIPIEWIEKFMNRFRLDMVISDEYALLHFMLTEWENENEID